MNIAEIMLPGPFYIHDLSGSWWHQINNQWIVWIKGGTGSGQSGSMLSLAQGKWEETVTTGILCHSTSYHTIIYIHFFWIISFFPTPGDPWDIEMRSSFSVGGIQPPPPPFQRDIHCTLIAGGGRRNTNIDHRRIQRSQALWKYFW
jgi:hypothetical protein